MTCCSKTHRANPAWGVLGITALILATIWGSPSAGRSAPLLEESARKALRLALPALQRGATGHVGQKTCFACHNQATPLLAITVAARKGFPADPTLLSEQRAFIKKFLASNEAGYREGKGQGGQVTTAGYALWTLEMCAAPKDATTEAVSEYFLRTQSGQDHWTTNSQRPPSEGSDFTSTYLALRGLKQYGLDSQSERAARRRASALTWLRRTSGRDTEDRVFRLLALRAAGAEAMEVTQAAAELWTSQRGDGGWSQLDTLGTDPYATGQVLYALQVTNQTSGQEESLRRGLEYLLKTQLPDGTWHVLSRSKPFQPYYESGFPHGEHQFISCAASGWAATALALTLPDR